MKIKGNSIRQMIRFAVVGCANTAVDYVVFYLMISFVHLHKSIAQVFATGVAMCGSFLLNRRWTFEKTGRGKTSELIKFVCVNIVAMLTAIAFTHLFYDILHVEQAGNQLLAAMRLPYTLQGNAAVMFAKIIASVFSVAVNFLGNKFWVFRTKKEWRTL